MKMILACTTAALVALTALPTLASVSYNGTGTNGMGVNGMGTNGIERNAYKLRGNTGAARPTMSADGALVVSTITLADGTVITLTR